mgnify:CR=1 FL=1
MRTRHHPTIHPLDPLLAELRRLVDDVGDPVWVGYDTAAALHPFDGFRLRRPFHLVVPRGRSLHRVGHVIHTLRDIRPIDTEEIFGLPVMSPTRTLLQIAAHHDLTGTTHALDGALRDGLTSEDALHRRLAELRRPGRDGTKRLLDALQGREITRGGHSWLEREFLRLAHIAGLPRPRTQAILARRRDRLVRVDAWFDGTPVVVELLGYRWHRTTIQMSVDAERMNRLVLDGYLPLQFTYQQIVTEAVDVMATVGHALDRYIPARDRT